MNKKIVIGTWPLSGDWGPVSLKKAINILEKAYFEYGFNPDNGIKCFKSGNEVIYSMELAVNGCKTNKCDFAYFFELL